MVALAGLHQSQAHQRPLLQVQLPLQAVGFCRNPRVHGRFPAQIDHVQPETRL
ncbi:hypothetical protein D3C75_1377860 [compost metagenome]